MYLNNTEDALVEARRIELQNNQQTDKNSTEKKYYKDAFSLIMQGIVYEKAKDINNAFISYRNAADVFLKAKDGVYYGTSMPEQLKKDVLRTAYQNGFISEMNDYQKQFNTQFSDSNLYTNGSIVLFWENGLAPVKKEQNFFFTLVNKNGGFFFIDNATQNEIPFQMSATVNMDKVKLSELESFRIAFPRYEERPVTIATTRLLNQDSVNFYFEPVQNINQLAFQQLKERSLKEMAEGLARLAVKKIAEQIAKPTKEGKDKDKNKDAQEALAFGIQAFNFFSEKADTRNWQTLPHTIYYTRIPLNKGANHFDLNLISTNNISRIISFDVVGDGSLKTYNICTLQ